MANTLFKLKSKFSPAGDQPEAIDKLVRGLEKGSRYQTLVGVTGSGKTFTVASVLSQFDMPVLVMAPNKALAAQLYREYKNFFPESSVNYFVSYYDYYQPEAYMPSSDTYIEKEAMINDEIDRLRHQATTALSIRRDVIIVASVSCIYNLGIPASYTESSLHLELDKPIVRQDLIKQLVKIQFERTPGELKRGLFRVRGDLFEIMPAAEKIIYQIAFKDQKVAEIKLVDPLTRQIKDKLNEIIIFPPKHFVSSMPEIKEAVKSIKIELKDRLKYYKDKGLFLEAERLERRTRYDMEMLLSLGYCHGIENYSRHLTGKLPGESPDTLLAYFPRYADGSPDFLTIIDESHIAVPQIRGMYAGDKARKETLIQYGWRLPSALDNRPLNFKEFEQRIGQTLFTTATPGKWEIEKSGRPIRQVIRPTGLIDPPVEIRPVYNKKTDQSQIDDLIKEIKSVISSRAIDPVELNGIATLLPATRNDSKKTGRIIVNTLTKKMAEDLDEYLKKQGLKVNYIHSDIKTIERTDILKNFRKGKFDILIGVNLLREGLDLPEVTLVAILDADREGFLRSETSLMQTMGRAARNVTGKVILYADTVTRSMKRALKEVESRRLIQKKYNQQHGITPETISKEIEDFLDLTDANDTN
ncbi:MAG TPA: helicase-related protein [Patescibacteria group bacterium]|nr:helicase-related protein [Patescibacteria group bacterium]